MANQRHLAKAPITEALVDFRAELPPASDAAILKALAEQIRETYPTAEPIRIFAGEIRLSPGGVSQTAAERGLLGLLCKSADGTRIVQLRRDGFTFNKLRPYTSWNDVFAEAWRLWDLYRGAVAPGTVPRIAVRYINHINLPAGSGLDRYLVDPPTGPPEASGSIHSYFKRVVVQDPITGHFAAVVQALEPGRDGVSQVLLLDIDVYTFTEGRNADGELRDIFLQLRQEKNRLFFGALTEEAVRMFE
jgi:uncharacterized protein (TIGR04255 family)